MKTIIVLFVLNIVSFGYLYNRPECKYEIVEGLPKDKSTNFEIYRMPSLREVEIHHSDHLTQHSNQYKRYHTGLIYYFLDSDVIYQQEITKTGITEGFYSNPKKLEIQFDKSDKMNIVFKNGGA